jgi:hypothetical protein
MGVKAHIPIGIAIEGIELAKGGVFSFIAPSEAPVLQMDFMKLASLKSDPETVDAATINVWLVLVPSPPDLVEVTEDQPPHTNRRLMNYKLREEVILPRACGWPINRGDFEIPIPRGIDDVNIGRKAKFGRHNIGHLHKVLVP